MYKNIVVVGPQHADTLPKSILVTLESMGYKVSAVDEREMLGISFKKGVDKNGRLGFFTRAKKAAIETLIVRSSKYEFKTYSRLAGLIEKNNPDLIITVSAKTPPEIISRLKKNTGAKIVLWFPDHPGNIGRQYFFAAPYDALFFKDRFLVDRALSLGLSAHYLPEACMPKWHKRVELTEEEKEIYECDITTAGNMYYFRAKVFEPLIKKYKVKLWGLDIPRWLKSPVKKVYQGRAVSELEKSKAFNGAKIVLNTFQGEFLGVNQRFFEIAGCGGFQLCEHRDEIKNFFEIDKEIVTFKNPTELLEKVDYYLHHDDERKRIADTAYARAHREYTFQKRLEKMFEIIAE
ncbi:MAG: glycosyltransferase [Candidatus Liptonbacteria bacterium]|nr:glycosyltransferase [Candidatus Liptonbacteria bacterium]